MATKSFEERLAEISEQEKKALKKANQYKERRLALEKKQKEEERKKRTHRLIEIGGAVESVLGRALEEDEIQKLIGFLKREDKNGNYFMRAMDK